MPPGWRWSGCAAPRPRSPVWRRDRAISSRCPITNAWRCSSAVILEGNPRARRRASRTENPMADIVPRLLLAAPPSLAGIGSDEWTSISISPSTSPTTSCASATRCAPGSTSTSLASSTSTAHRERHRRRRLGHPAPVGEGLAVDRLLNITWPEEYGGRGGTLNQEIVFLLEFVRAGALLGRRARPRPLRSHARALRHARAENGSSRPSPAPRSSGGRASASLTPVPTSRASVPRPSDGAASGWCPARRSGCRSGCTPTGSTCCAAPTPTPRATAASRC